MSSEKVQLFARWTDIYIALGVVGEGLTTEKLGAVIHISNGNVGTDALLAGWQPDFLPTRTSCPR